MRTKEKMPTHVVVIVIICFIVLPLLCSIPGYLEQKEYNNRHKNGDTLTQKEVDSLMNRVDSLRSK